MEFQCIFFLCVFNAVYKLIRINVRIIIVFPGMGFVTCISLDVISNASSSSMTFSVIL